MREVECQSLAEALEAAGAGAEVVPKPASPFRSPPPVTQPLP